MGFQNPWAGRAALLVGLVLGVVGLRNERGMEGEATRAGAEVTAVAWRDAEPAPMVAAVESTEPAGRRQRQLGNALRARSVAAPDRADWREGERLTLPLFDGAAVLGVVRATSLRPDGGKLVSGTLKEGGTFTLVVGAADGGLQEALILPASGGSAYRIVPAEAGGGLLLAELRKDSVLCATLPRPSSTPAAAAITPSSGRAVTSAVVSPLLNSRPEAEPVLYLDFDGQTVNDPIWNGGVTIEAAPSGLSEAEIRRVWAMVAEDYRPFRINVTTDPARYAAARPMQRIRCILTPTRQWYGDAGGVALIFSWRDAGASTFAADVPCWVFTEPGVMTAEDVALAASHEAGHTLGLYHDGLRGADGVTPPEGDYYQGQGSGATAWGPIMGAPYGKPLIQWSRGDYSVGLKTANNPQDDIALIATIENHVGFAPDRRADTLADAGRLAVAADGVTVDHRGLVERAGAESWLIFASGAGQISLELAPDDPALPIAANFDGALTLTTASGAVVATADQGGTCFPRLSASVPAGVYVLRVKSVGEGSPSAGGYSNYGSIGRFRVVGRIAAAAAVAPLLGGSPRGEGRAGDPISYQIEAAGFGLVYTADNLPPGLTVGADGHIAGVPNTCGVWRSLLRVSNNAGTATREVTFAVAGASLGESVDAVSLHFVTGGARPWRSVAEAGAPQGGSNARSGELLDDNGESWIETMVIGPGTLRWKWRVSSEKDYDLLHASLDGAPVAAISGEVAWADQVLEIGSGAHVLRWSYDKDDYLSEHADSAWLDDVRWERGFERWASEAALTGADAVADADPDHDGVPNLLEYAAARDPRRADGVGDVVRVTSAESDSAGEAPEAVQMEIVFIRPPNREDLRYVVEVSADLVNWVRGHAYGAGEVNPTSGLATVEMERAMLSDGSERIRVRDGTVLGPGAPRRFIRLKVERI